MARRILGIAGAPGVGKSTYAERLVAEADEPAAYLPMDGFHLADTALSSLGLLDRKGAPETFDAWGYAALLARIRTVGHTVWAPTFERHLEQPLAGSIAVAPDVALVVTEGNYLLLDEPPWSTVRRLLDECWYVEVPEELRHARLEARHRAFGRSAAEAHERTYGSDERNAHLIAATAPAADAIIRPGR